MCAESRRLDNVSWGGPLATAPTPSEKRICARVRPRSLVSLAIYQGYNIPPAYGIVTDISQNGARIESDRILAKGQNVQLRIQFAEESPFEAGGRVRWTRPRASNGDGRTGGGFSGIALESVSPHDTQRLKCLLGSQDFDLNLDRQFDDFLEALRPQLRKLGDALAMRCGRGNGRRG